jgi:hypothetical protein
METFGEAMLLCELLSTCTYIPVDFFHIGYRTMAFNFDPHMIKSMLCIIKAMHMPLAEEP